MMGPATERSTMESRAVDECFLIEKRYQGTLTREKTERLVGELRELVPANIPIAVHFPCGHGKSIVPLPLGSVVRLETTNKKVVLTCVESPFA